jgi:hypothetical protein
MQVSRLTSENIDAMEHIFLAIENGDSQDIAKKLGVHPSTLSSFGRTARAIGIDVKKGHAARMNKLNKRLTPEEKAERIRRQKESLKAMWSEFREFRAAKKAQSAN